MEEVERWRNWCGGSNSWRNSMGKQIQSEVAQFAREACAVPETLGSSLDEAKRLDSKFYHQSLQTGFAP
jgi:hypothetical protein